MIQVIEWFRRHPFDDFLLGGPTLLVEDIQRLDKKYRWHIRKNKENAMEIWICQKRNYWRFQSLLNCFFCNMSSDQP